MVLPFVRRDVLQHRLEPLLELAAVLRAREQRCHVERQHALVLERLGHRAVDDALRESLDDRGLADAGLADQHRIVLGAALQDLDRPADLVVAADHRVELAFAGALGEVDRVLLERLALALGLGRRDARAAAHRVDRALERLLREAGLLEHPAAFALVIGEREQEELARDELVAALGGELVGEIEQVVQVARHADLAAGALDLGHARDRRLERRLQLRHGDARAGEQRRRAAVLLREQGREQVLGLDESVVVPEREALGIGERLLELGGQLVETHRISDRGTRAPFSCQMGQTRAVFKGHRRRRRPVECLAGTCLDHR